MNQNKQQRQETGSTPVVSVATALTLLFFTSLLSPYKVPLLVRRPRPGPDISNPSDIKESGDRLSTSLGKTAQVPFPAREPTRGAARQQNINAVIYMKLLAYQRHNSICLTSAVQSAEGIDLSGHCEGPHSSMWLILCTLGFFFFLVFFFRGRERVFGSASRSSFPRRDELS